MIQDDMAARRLKRRTVDHSEDRNKQSKQIKTEETEKKVYHNQTGNNRVERDKDINEAVVETSSLDVERQSESSHLIKGDIYNKASDKQNSFHLKQRDESNSCIEDIKAIPGQEETALNLRDIVQFSVTCSSKNNEAEFQGSSAPNVCMQHENTKHSSAAGEDFRSFDKTTEETKHSSSIDLETELLELSASMPAKTFLMQEDSATKCTNDSEIAVEHTNLTTVTEYDKDTLCSFIMRNKNLDLGNVITEGDGLKGNDISDQTQENILRNKNLDSDNVISEGDGLTGNDISAETQENKDQNTNQTNENIMQLIVVSTESVNEVTHAEIDTVVASCAGIQEKVYEANGSSAEGMKVTNEEISSADSQENGAKESDRLEALALDVVVNEATGIENGEAVNSDYSPHASQSDEEIYLQNTVQVNTENSTANNPVNTKISTETNQSDGSSYAESSGQTLDIIPQTVAATNPPTITGIEREGKPCLG